MKKVIKEIEEVELSVAERLMADIVASEKVSKKMTEVDLLNFVADNIGDADIKSKNGMLKHLRASGLSCSMDRVFNMYKLVEDELKKEKIAEDTKGLPAEAKEEKAKA